MPTNQSCMKRYMARCGSSLSVDGYDECFQTLVGRINDVIKDASGFYLTALREKVDAAECQDLTHIKEIGEAALKACLIKEVAN